MDGGVEGPDAVCEGYCHDEAGGAIEHDGPDHCSWKHARCVADLLSFGRFVSIVDAVLRCCCGLEGSLHMCTAESEPISA